MKEIGGYFGLEHVKKEHYHNDAIKLNSSRYAIEYILRVRKYKKIYIPYYICDSAIQPAEKVGINIEFYNIDNNFMPMLNKNIDEGEVFLFVNYFGLLSDRVSEIINKYKNVIIDNTQAFFVRPIKDIDTVYSPRKFVGVSDGGYLYSNCNKIELEKDISYYRYKYILKRIDLGASSGYEDFLKNEDQLDQQEILEMSKLTSTILDSLDYKYIKNKRENNFKILHNEFKNINKLDMPEIIFDNGPMVYPLLIDNDIRRDLIESNIYVSTYWKDVLKRVDNDSYEEYLVNNLLPLPIDQRYDEDDMKYIVEVVNTCIRKK